MKERTIHRTPSLQQLKFSGIKLNTNMVAMILNITNDLAALAPCPEPPSSNGSVILMDAVSSKSKRRILHQTNVCRNVIVYFLKLEHIKKYRIITKSRILLLLIMIQMARYYPRNMTSYCWVRFKMQWLMQILYSSVINSYAGACAKCAPLTSNIV